MKDLEDLHVRKKIQRRGELWSRRTNPHVDFLPDSVIGDHTRFVLDLEDSGE